MLPAPYLLVSQRLLLAALREVNWAVKQCSGRNAHVIQPLLQRWPQPLPQRWGEQLRVEAIPAVPSWFSCKQSHTSSILINQFLYWYLDMFLVDESGAYNSWDFVFYLTLGICGTTCYPFKWKAEFNLETPHCYADDEWWSGGWISKTLPKDLSWEGSSVSGCRGYPLYVKRKGGNSDIF